MVLKDNFFRIRSVAGNESGMVYSITLDASHPVYAAHFPGNPVTPGVCIVQIVEELSGELLQKPVSLRKAFRVKLQNVIDPRANADIDVSLAIAEEDGIYKVAAEVFAGHTVFSKLSLILGDK
mgnify:CR=1 FL=1